MTTVKHGIEVLWDPSLNKSTAFTEEEKQALGIIGLVPDVTEIGGSATEPGHDAARPQSDRS